MTFALPLSEEFIQRLAERVADELMDEREYLDTGEAAAYLRLTRKQLLARTHASETREPIPFRREGRRYLFVRRELDEWLDRGGGELD